MTLWIMAMLSIFALGIGYRASLELRLVRYQIDQLKTLYIAKAAVQEVKQYLALDLVSDTKDYDSLYRCGIYLLPEETPEEMFKNITVGDGSYTIKYKTGDDEFNQPIWRYGLNDEEGKININQAEANTLTYLFELAGADVSESESIAASIIDWRDADSIVSDNGAENDYYQNLETPYNCKNADFDTLEELLLVRDMTPEIFGQVKDYLTVYGESKKVNINTASQLVLQALAISAGGEATFADNIIDYRSGSDKIEATSDDNPCLAASNTMNYLEDALGSTEVGGEVISNFNNFITTKSANFRVEIQATSADGKVIKNITAILDNNGVVKFWQEE